MGDRFKLVIYNRSIYKEVELLPEYTKVTIGTYYDSDIRLRKELFLMIFPLFLRTTEIAGVWNALREFILITETSADS